MADQDATQTGAEELKPAYSARTSAIQQIAQNVHAQNSGDLASFDEETGSVVKNDAPQNEDEKPVREEKDEVKEEPLQQDDSETIVVDGREVKVKRDQLIDAGRRTLQKESAADKRLQEATEALNRVKAYERNLLQRQPSSDAGESEQMPSSDASNSASQAAPVNQREVVESVLWDREASKAVKTFEKEFGDIVSDPLAMRLVVQLENERIGLAANEGKTLFHDDPWEAYKTHGEKVREWLGKTKTASPVAVSDDKNERKRSATTVVGSSAKLQSSQPKKPLTLSEQIEQMRVVRQGRQIPNAR